MRIQMVRADQVVVGDELFAGEVDWNTKHKCWDFQGKGSVRVTKVEKIQMPFLTEHGYRGVTEGVRIETIAWTTMKSGPEAVAVMRP